MFRDFSDSSKQKLINLVSEVENDKLSDFTDWIGDKWYQFEEFIGDLNIRNYINDVNRYHKKVIDKNNTTKESINKIFSEVNKINNSYQPIFANINSLLDKWESYLVTMSEIVTPSNGIYNIDSMKSKLDSIYSDIKTCDVQCLKDQMVQNIGGELVYNEKLICEYMKKDVAELSDEEQAMLVGVLATLKDTVALYETIATYGNDVLGGDVLNYVSWLAQNKQYESFSAVSAHYNEIYINLLNYMSECSQDNHTFASSLVKISNGETDLSLLGASYCMDVGKIFDSKSFAVYVASYKSEHTEQYFAKLELSEKDNMQSNGKFQKVNDYIKDKLKKSNQYFQNDHKTYYDKDGNVISSDNVPTFYKKELSIAEIRKQINASISLYEGKFDIGENGSVEVVVGNAEAHASISGGFYVVGADGEKKFSPGVNAEVGASATALEVEWKQQWVGDENLGLNSDVDVTAGKAEAKANIGAQIYGQDGKLDVQLGGSASAEAIAGEVEGSLGVNVLGGEVAANGSVNVGVGAHADVGYKDGVFKSDIGASLGVGVSVGIEVDVGGMVDTVSDFASSAWDDIQDGWNSIWN